MFKALLVYDGDLSWMKSNHELNVVKRGGTSMGFAHVAIADFDDPLQWHLVIHEKIRKVLSIAIGHKSRYELRILIKPGSHIGFDLAFFQKFFPELTYLGVAVE